MANALDLFEDGNVTNQADGAFAVFEPLEHFATKMFAKDDVVSDAHATAGANERPPDIVAIGDRMKEQGFDIALTIGTFAIQARREDFGIVHDEAVTGLQIIGQITKMAIFPTAFALMKDQETRCGTVG